MGMYASHCINSPNMTSDICVLLFGNESLV
jgi:hypothetical protein